MSEKNDIKTFHKYFEIYLKEKSLFETGKKKYQKCDECSGNKKFLEKDGELIYTCGSDEGKCGKQIKIKLPHYVHYESEKEKLNEIINGSFHYTEDSNDLSNYNLEKISKYMKIPDELKKQNEDKEKATKDLDELHKLYLKENDIKKKNEMIQDLHSTKQKGIITKRNLLNELQLNTTTDERKREIKKEYAKIIHANNNIIYPLLDELKKDINYDLMISPPETIVYNSDLKKKKDKTKKDKTKKDKTKKKDKNRKDKTKFDKSKKESKVEFKEAEETEEAEEAEEVKNLDKLGDKQEEMEPEIAKQTDDSEKIKYFSRSKNNKWLSAFNVGKPFTYDGYEYPSVEHAFHAQKIDPKDPKADEYKTKLSNKDLKASEAKKIGGKKSFKENNYLFRKDWDQIKLKLMKEITEEYYKNNPELLEKLKETGSKELVHTGPLIDSFWGINNKGGENNHGKILMEIRDNLSLKKNKSDDKPKKEKSKKQKSKKDKPKKLTKEGKKWAKEASKLMKQMEK